MANIIKDSSTRIKTGVVLIIAMVIVGYIDSYFLMWLLFGTMLMISISEAKKLFLDLFFCLSLQKTLYYVNYRYSTLLN